MSTVSCMRMCSSAELRWLCTLLAITGLSCDNGNRDLGENPGPLPHYETIDCNPAWCPDSDWIAFERLGEETDQFEAIFLIRPDGSGQERMVDWGLEPDWSPQGDRIMYLDGRDGLSTRVYNLASDSAWVQFSSGRIFSVDWSPDGAKVAGARSVDGTHNICVSDLEHLQCRWIGSGEEPDWSPDGSELLCRWNGLSIMDSSGTNRRQVITCGLGDALIRDAHWRPDGGRIVFSRLDDPTQDYFVWLVNPDGTGLTCLGTGTDPAWSPDGEQIVFADDVPEGDWRSVRLWIMNADGTERRQLTFPDTTTAASRSLR